MPHPTDISVSGVIVTMMVNINSNLRPEGRPNPGDGNIVL